MRPVALLLSTAAIAVLAGTGTAAAKTSASAALEQSGNLTRIVVTLKGFAGNAAARTVQVKLGAATYRLSKRGRGKAWASKGLEGAQAAPLLAAAGKPIRVKVRSRSGKLTLLRPTLVAAPTAPVAPTAPEQTTPPPAAPQSPAPTSPSPTPSQPDAKTRFLTLLTSYGYNAPCVGQACGNDLMNFCPNGSFADRFTSGNTGQDYHYTGSWQLVSEVVSGTYAGYPVVEAHVTAQTTDQWGTPKTFDWIVDLSENYQSGLFGGQEFGRTSISC